MLGARALASSGMTPTVRHHQVSPQLRRHITTTIASAERWSRPPTTSGPYRRGGVVRARRLSPLLTLRQVVRHSGLDVSVDASDRHRAHGLPDPSRPADLALGVVRSSDERLAPAQPRPRLLQRGEGPSRRQARRDLRGPPVRPALLPRPAQPRSRRRLRDALLTTPSVPAAGIAHANITAPPPASRAGRPLPHPTPTAPPSSSRGTPDHDCCRRRHHFVEHPGNAGRPHAAHRPIASLHRPSGRSKLFLLASLRALHLDQHLRPGALRTNRRRDPHWAHTANRWLERVQADLPIGYYPTGAFPTDKQLAALLIPSPRLAPRLELHPPPTMVLNQLRHFPSPLEELVARTVNTPSTRRSPRLAQLGGTGGRSVNGAACRGGCPRVALSPTEYPLLPLKRCPGQFST